jgi:hypothetical protein
MAVGDAAAAAGLPLVPDTGEDGKVKWGAREINRTRDEVADVMTSRARSKVSSTPPASPQVNDLWFEPI